MANVDRPNGLKPVRYQNGNPYNGAHNLYFAPTGSTSAIFIGDVVTLTGNQAAAGTNFFGTDVAGMPEVAAFVASDGLPLGVVVGVYPNPDRLGTTHRLASTASIIMVADAPDLIFEVQESTGTAFTATMTGLNADLVVGTGNATTGTSDTELDVSVTPLTTTLTVRLLRLVPRPDNALGANARWEVKFVEHSGISATGI